MASAWQFTKGVVKTDDKIICYFPIFNTASVKNGNEGIQTIYTLHSDCLDLIIWGSSAQWNQQILKLTALF